VTDTLKDVNGTRATWRSAIVSIVFAAAMFALGYLLSYRQVREAQQAAGEAERQKLAAEAALADAQNRLLLKELEGQRPADGNRNQRIP